MMRLLRVEVRRYFSRRLTKLTALAVLAIVGVMLLGVQQDAYNSVPSRLDERTREHVQQCQDAQQQARASEPDVDFHCTNISKESLGPVITSFATTAQARTANLALLFGAAGFFIGAAFLAGEFSTGSMGTWLTFEPRRRRVYASKVAAATLGAVPLVALWLGVLFAGIAAIMRVNGLSTALTGSDGADVAWLTIRVLVICAAAGAGGAVLGSLLRHTAAALGVMLGYAILVEAVFPQLITRFVPEPQPWLVYSNFQAVIQNGWTYRFDPCGGPGGGGSCQDVQHSLSLAHGSVYFAILVSVVVFVGAWVFQRRDVH